MSESDHPAAADALPHESRCRAVQLMLDGAPIALAAARAGANGATG